MTEALGIDLAAAKQAAAAGANARPLWNRAWRQAVEDLGADAAIGLLTPRTGTGYGMLFTGSAPRLPLDRDKIELLHRRLDNGSRTARASQWRTVGTEIRGMLSGRFDNCDLVLTRALAVSDAELFWPIIGFPGGAEPRHAQVDRCASVLALAAKACVGDLSAQRSQRLLECVLNQLSASTFITDERGQLIWTNQAGRHGLLAGEPLRCRGGRLLATDREDAQAMGEAYAAFASGKTARRLPADRMFALGRGGSQRGALLRMLDFAGMAGPIFLLILFAEGDDLSAVDFKHVFGLIPSEARFIGSMMRHGSLKAAASALGISEQSARTYLKRVYAKLGVSNQLEMACLVASYTPPVRRGETASEDELPELT